MSATSCPTWCTATATSHDLSDGKIGTHEHRIEIPGRGSVAAVVAFDDEGAEPAVVDAWRLDVGADEGLPVEDAAVIGRALVEVADIVARHNAGAGS